MQTIKLKSSDGEIFNVDVEVAKMSQTIKTMLEHAPDDDDEAVPLMKVNSAILKKVLEWAENHRGDEPSETENDEDSNLWPLASDIDSAWDTRYVDVDMFTLYQLFRAADFLDIKGLRELTCKAIANKIKGKNTEEIIEIFDRKILSFS